MKIPEKIKVGGVTYSIEITNNIGMGFDYSAEIDYKACVIRVRPMAADKMERDLFHEIMRAIFDACGYTEHDEGQIDRIAVMIHAIVKDNPNIFGGEEDATS